MVAAERGLMGSARLSAARLLERRGSDHIVAPGQHASLRVSMDRSSLGCVAFTYHVLMSTRLAGRYRGRRRQRASTYRLQPT